MKHLSLPLLLSLFILSLLTLSPVTARCEAQTVSPAEKKAFITVADLRAFGYSNPKMPPAKWSKTVEDDGTYELLYEVETPDSEMDAPLLIDETLSDQNTALEARAYLAAMRGLMNLAFKSQGMTERAMPKQTIYGDGSSLTTVISEGETVGNIFSARKHGRTFTLLIFGVSFDTPKQWDNFAGKKIRAWLNAAK